MSSARYKHDIRDMGDQSSALFKLRPVSFRYNNDRPARCSTAWWRRRWQKIYPELVVYGPDGKVMTARYSMLGAMLLHELQKQNRELQKQRAELLEQTRVNGQQADQNRKLAAQVAWLKANQEHQRVAFEQRFATLSAR